MKKILLFNLTPRMGMLHHCASFANELVKNYDVYVVIADYYDWFLYDKSVKLLKIKTDPSVKSFLFDSLMFWNQIKLWKKINKIKPDIIHFMDNHPRYPFYIKYAKRHWYTVYVTQHDPVLHTWENKWLMWNVSLWMNKVLREKADKLIVHWEHLKQQEVDLYNISPDKIVVVPIWNYNTIFTRRWKWSKPQKDYFLFFWRISDYKWLDVLLESVNKVKKTIRSFKLMVVGFWDLTKYEKLINENKEYIELYNFDIPDEEVYKYFEKAEFVVLPYKDATWSWVVPTAFSFSKAVVTTDVWELATHVANKKSWLIINPNNVEALSDAIIWMLNNKEKVVEMWKEWRKYTENALWWDKIVDKIY